MFKRVRARLRRRRTAPGGRMSLVDHLEELRYRIFICLGAYVVLVIVAYFLYRPILNLLLHPLHHSGTIGSGQATIKSSEIKVYLGGIATGFVLRMKTSAFAGLVFALPVILFQLFRFVTPGLEPRERKFAIPFVVSAVLLFVLGGYIAFLILPLGIHWLLGFVAPAQPLIQLNEYMNFVFLLILAFGISFEFPLVLISLAGVGILSSRQLSRARRAAILSAFVIAAVATPSQDPISQIVMAVPLYILYELSILVIKYGLKR